MSSQLGVLILAFYVVRFQHIFRFLIQRLQSAFKVQSPERRILSEIRLHSSELEIRVRVDVIDYRLLLHSHRVTGCTEWHQQ